MAGEKPWHITNCSTPLLTAARTVKTLRVSPARVQSVIRKMELLKNIIRWVLLLGLIAMGLLYLNSTAYSLWAAGGPPTEVPHAWLNRALVHFGFSVAFIFTGIMCFKALKNGFYLKKSKLLKYWLITLLIVLGYPQLREFYLVDKCLDSGGAWSKRHFECKH